MIPRASIADARGAVMVNLHTDPRATRNALDMSKPGQFGWQARWFGSGGATGTHTTVTSASDGPSGISTYIRKQWTVMPTNNVAGDCGWGLTSAYSNHMLGMAVKPGQLVTASAYVRISNASPTGTALVIRYYRYDSSGALLGSGDTGTTVTIGNWLRPLRSMLIPDDGTAIIEIVAQPTIYGITTDTTIDITGGMITVGTQPSAYSDPGHSSWRWLGTPNASASAGPRPIT